MTGPALVALDIAGPPDAWGRLGMEVADSVAQLGAVTLRFGAEGSGITGWALRGAAGPPELDGLRTLWLPAPVTSSAPVHHGIGLLAVDHVVVLTPDPGRTFAAFADAGLQLRREREATDGGRTLRQGFFRHGETVVEVVGPLEARDDGPARLWGLTFVTSDLDGACATLAEHADPPKDAVQPGRRIATVRRSLGLGVPVALITPEA